MSKKNLILGALLVVLVVVGVFIFNNDKTKINDPIVIDDTKDDTVIASEDINNIVNANNKFALEFHSILSNENPRENIFFSPYSISTAMAMVYEGARGDTANEIRSVFNFQKDDAIRRLAMQVISSRLNREDTKHKLQTANALWMQKDYQFLDEFKDVVSKYYGGKAVSVDFVGATEESRKKINSWVEQETNNKIKNLFPEGTLNALTRLVLTNAIYFKGDWANQFEKDNTKEEYLSVGGNKKVKVPMMSKRGSEVLFKYAETEKLQILEIPYEGEEISMLVLLPKYNNDIKDLEKSLTTESLSRWKSILKKQQVDIYLPKFSFNNRYLLNDKLKAMGMPSAFTHRTADFSGIDGTQNLFIQAVIHQSFVEVNEEGTEAAAATGVSIGVTSVAMPVVFRADRPFLFLIQETRTGKILFMGKISNPIK